MTKEIKMTIDEFFSKLVGHTIHAYVAIWVQHTITTVTEETDFIITKQDGFYILQADNIKFIIVPSSLKSVYITPNDNCFMSATIFFEDSEFVFRFPHDREKVLNLIKSKEESND